ncbi:MAG TPA: MFS transporter [bacterium]|nr:MFS transporter [bacterium]
MHLSTTFRALGSRNYRLYFWGQALSLIGTWMQTVALGWLVYRLTDSAFLLGVVGFSSQIPTLFLAPLTGVAADRFPRRAILVTTQTLFMVQALLLAAIVLLHVETIPIIILLSLFHGTVMAFDAPARHAFVVEIVATRDDLSNGIALNSALFHASRLIGPAAAGILIMLWGEGICFLINGLSYIATIAALAAIRLAPAAIERNGEPILAQFAAGLRYVRDSLPIKSVLLLVAFICFVGMPYTTLLPIIARDVLHGDSSTFGYLMSGAGIGALAGALYLASRPNNAALLGNLVWAPGLFGAGAVAISFSRSFPVSFLILAIAAFGMMTVMATSNTILQNVVSEKMRGRVMSLYTISFFGSVPFGNLLAGSLAAHLGAPATIFIAGALCIVAAAVFKMNYPKIERELAVTGVAK